MSEELAALRREIDRLAKVLTEGLGLHGHANAIEARLNARLVELEAELLQCKEQLGEALVRENNLLAASRRERRSYAAGQDGGP